MVKVTIEKRCGCFTREGMSGVYEFETKSDADKKVTELLELMNNKFCGKHKFKKLEQANEIVIVEDEEG